MSLGFLEMKKTTLTTTRQLNNSPLWKLICEYSPVTHKLLRIADSEHFARITLHSINQPAGLRFWPRLKLRVRPSAFCLFHPPCSTLPIVRLTLIGFELGPLSVAEVHPFVTF